MDFVYHTAVTGSNEPLEAMIPVIAAAGIEAIEAHSTTMRWFEPHIEEQLEAVRATLRQTGVEVYSVHGPWGEELDWCSKDDEVCQLAQGMLGSVIEWSAQLGASVVVLHPGRIGEGETDAAYVERVANGIAPLVVTAETEDITLALENMPYEREDTTAMAKVARLAGSERLTVCLDTGHAHINESLAVAVEAGGGLIGHIHMHDNDGEHDQHLLPGEGTINWEDIAPLIGPDGDYEGATVLEVRRPEDLALVDLRREMSKLVLVK